MGIVKTNRVLLLASDRRELKGFGDEYIKEVVGVGAISAALHTAHLISKHSPDFVVSIGSAGRVSKELEVGKAYSFKCVNNDLIDLSEVHISLGSSLDREGSTYGPLKTFDTSSPYILTTTGKYSRSMKESYKTLSSSAVDMEAYGVALSCRELGIPFFAVKLITDTIECDAAISSIDREYRVSREALISKVKEVLSQFDPL